MAAQTSIWGQIFKWLIVPVALVALGYFLIGPRLGSTPIPKLLGPTGLVAPPAKDNSTEPPKPVSTASPPNEPTVRVNVRPVVQRTYPTTVVHRRVRHKRHRSTTKATIAPESKAAPPTIPDEGGSGGATTAGN